MIYDIDDLNSGTPSRFYLGRKLKGTSLQYYNEMRKLTHTNCFLLDW